MMGRTPPRATPISPATPPPPDAPLSLRLRSATRELHRAAERAGLMADLLHGRIEAPRYAALLANLQALYVALEGALDRHAARPGFDGFGFDALRRVPALAADLQQFDGAADAPPVPAMQVCVARLHTLADTQPTLLIAHAYVRYLGDLNGGQLLRDIVARALHVDADAQRFYAFGSPAFTAAAIARFRAALDALPLADAGEAQALVDEARWAFAQHVALFDELAA